MRVVQHSSLTLVAALMLGALSACGGGGSGSASTSGSTYTASYAGPIAGLGSIVVNGVRFETVGVTVEDSDDIYGTTKYSKSLDLGMTVALGGDVDESAMTGTPSKIRVIGGVRGKVSATTATSITTLNGQTVTVDANTLYAGTRSALADITTTDYVEIYGVTQSNGDFLATRVITSASLSTTNKLAIRGTINSLPTAANPNQYVIKTSSSATVTVSCDPSAASPCVKRPAGATLVAAAGSVPGTPVRVVAADSTSLVSGVLNAVKIQSLNPEQLAAFDGVASTYAKIKGYTSLVGTDWYVGGVKVTGYTFTAAGQFVEVKGTWSNGVLQATKVELESQRTTVTGVAYKNELYGAVSSLSGNTFVVQGVTVNAATAIFSGGTLQTLANGNYVEVKGTLSGSTLTAVRVEIKNTQSAAATGGTFAGARFELYGTVTGWANANSTFTLTANGVAYTASLAPGAAVTGTIANNSSVEAKGALNASSQFIINKLEVKE